MLSVSLLCRHADTLESCKRFIMVFATADEVALLMDACRTMKSTVHAAFQVLSDLTCTQLLPEEQARDAMRAIVRMHGVHRLCHLLCPQVTPCHPDPMQSHVLAVQGGFWVSTAVGKQRCAQSPSAMRHNAGCMIFCSTV